MLFAMHALDEPNASRKRQDAQAAHTAHLKKASDYDIKIIMGGPLMSDDGEIAIGSLMMLEAPDSGAVEAFNHADPFYNTKVWKKVEIHRFEKRTG